jgi:hypothetical protein
MLINMTQKLQLIALSSFLIMMSMQGWLVDRFDFNISIGIYFAIFILAYSYKAELLAYAYERFQKNILDVDFLILAFLTLHFIINYHISINGLSFAALFILFSSIGRAQDQWNKKVVINSILFAAILCAIGVMIGFIEGMLGNSSIFNRIQPPNYPSPVLNIFNSLFSTNWHYQISGFQLSINYTAYLLIGGLATISFTDYSQGLKNIFIAIFISALILSQAKIGYLFLTFFGIRILFNSAYTLLIVISFSYLALSHLTINPIETVLENAHYFKSKVFLLGDYEFYVSFFLWLKISAFHYLNASHWFLGNYNEFIATVSAEPHSLWVSLVLIGGPITTLLVLIKFLQVERNYRETDSMQSTLFFAAFYALIIETVVWDAFDAPIFWIIFLTIPMLLKERS